MPIISKWSITLAEKKEDAVWFTENGMILYHYLNLIQILLVRNKVKSEE